MAGLLHLWWGSLYALSRVAPPARMGA